MWRFLKKEGHKRAEYRAFMPFSVVELPKEECFGSKNRSPRFFIGKLKSAQCVALAVKKRQRSKIGDIVAADGIALGKNGHAPHDLSA